MKPETMKFLEENIRTKLVDMGLDNGFMAMTPKAQATKLKKINKWDSIKLESFCTVKETINK